MVIFGFGTPYLSSFTLSFCVSMWRFPSVIGKNCNCKQNTNPPGGSPTDNERQKKQECIPVGCVPFAAVAVCRGGGVSAGGGCILACTEADTPPCEQND